MGAMGPGTAALLGGAGLGLDLYGQNQAKKQAKADRKAVERQNAEQRKQDAWTNLISVAGGNSPTGYRNAQALPGIPQVDFGGALGDAGQLLSNYRSGQAQTERQAALDAQAAKTQQDTANYRQTMTDLQRTRIDNADRAARESQDLSRQRLYLDQDMQLLDQANKMNTPATPLTPSQQMDMLELKIASGKATPEEMASYESYRQARTPSSSAKPASGDPFLEQYRIDPLR